MFLTFTPSSSLFSQNQKVRSNELHFTGKRPNYFPTWDCVDAYHKALQTGFIGKTKTQLDKKVRSYLPPKTKNADAIINKLFKDIEDKKSQNIAGGEHAIKLPEYWDKAVTSSGSSSPQPAAIASENSSSQSSQLALRLAKKRSAPSSPGSALSHPDVPVSPKVHTPSGQRSPKRRRTFSITPSGTQSQSPFLLDQRQFPQGSKISTVLPSTHSSNLSNMSIDMNDYLADGTEKRYLPDIISSASNQFQPRVVPDSEHLRALNTDESNAVKTFREQTLAEEKLRIEQQALQTKMVLDFKTKNTPLDLNTLAGKLFQIELDDGYVPNPSFLKAPRNTKPDTPVSSGLSSMSSPSEFSYTGSPASSGSRGSLELDSEKESSFYASSSDDKHTAKHVKSGKKKKISTRRGRTKKRLTSKRAHGTLKYLDTKVRAESQSRLQNDYIQDRKTIDATTLTSKKYPFFNRSRDSLGNPIDRGEESVGHIRGRKIFESLPLEAREQMVSATQPQARDASLNRLYREYIAARADFYVQDLDEREFYYLNRDRDSKGEPIEGSGLATKQSLKGQWLRKTLPSDMPVLTNHTHSHILRPTTSLERLEEKYTEDSKTKGVKAAQNIKYPYLNRDRDVNGNPIDGTGLKQSSTITGKTLNKGLKDKGQVVPSLKPDKISDASRERLKSEYQALRNSREWVLSELDKKPFPYYNRPRNAQGVPIETGKGVISNYSGGRIRKDF